MNEEKQELRYRQAGVAGTEWSVATTPDEFMQNGVYELKVINDNGTLPFPFRFAGDDIAKLIVSDSGTNDRQQTSRIVVQTITITPSGTNRSITYTRTRRNVNGTQLWSSWVEPEAASTANIYDGSVTAEKLSDDIRPNVVNPLRPLFIAAGAEYNDSGADKTKKAPWGETVTHKAGHYYLNGLGDITEEQLCIIINKGELLTVGYSACGYKGRTNTYLQGISTNLNFSGYYWAQDCSCEVLNLGEVVNKSSFYRKIEISDNERFVGGCENLKHIIGARITISSNKNISVEMFSAPQLETVYCYKLNKNISFYLCANLSKNSVLYMVENASPTSAITITLHPDAYARLADDADIVAALEAQPLVLLVSV